jgi:hypothetical protein
MDATAIVAGYAAVVATGALAFNVWNALRTWQTRVEVKLRRMNILTPGEGEPVILFELTNHSGHKVKITHVGLDPIKRGGLHSFIPHPFPLPTAGPFEIPPRDSVQIWIKPDVLAEGDPQFKTRALIRTSDGRDFESKRVRVRELREDPGPGRS